MCRLFIGKKFRKKITSTPALYPSSENTDSGLLLCMALRGRRLVVAGELWHTQSFLYRPDLTPLELLMCTQAAVVQAKLVFYNKGKGQGGFFAEFLTTNEKAVNLLSSLLIGRDL